jgi:hypothetical protein
VGEISPKSKARMSTLTIIIIINHEFKKEGKKLTVRF